MVHGILQFTPSIAFRYVLHRCESRDIRCRESFRLTVHAGHLPRSPRTGRREGGGQFAFSLALSAPGFGSFHAASARGAAGTTGSFPPAARGPVWLHEFAVVCSAGFDNDPSAGSPTETLLRLLLPLNDKVQWTSCDVAGSEPLTSPQSEHFTGPFNRAGGTTRPVKARSASPAEGTRRPVHTERRTGRPIPKSNYELFNCNNLNIRYWSWNYRGCWHQTCPPMDPPVSQAPSPESNPNSPSPVTTMGRNLNDASPARGPCDPSSYHESSQQRAEPASTFYLINASLPEVGDQPGSIPHGRRRSMRMTKPWGYVTSRQQRQSFGNERCTLVFGQIGIIDILPSAYSASKSSSNNSRAVPTTRYERDKEHKICFAVHLMPHPKPTQGQGHIALGPTAEEARTGGRRCQKQGSNQPVHADHYSRTVAYTMIQASNTPWQPKRANHGIKQSPNHAPLGTKYSYPGKPSADALAWKGTHRATTSHNLGKQAAPRPAHTSQPRQQACHIHATTGTMCS
ncbi:hypothetical protein ACH5RR_012924 [Cinchona calisaya]|uniref:Uncharacterized protein n=1 Tax=Cinchona calisaya TaxID=153742 RepID=A0ABD3A290_9GENT